MLPKVLTKTYTATDPTADELCCAEVTLTSYSLDGYEPYQDSCGAAAAVSIAIETITIKGKRVMNRTAFCGEHIPRKYLRWFDFGGQCSTCGYNYRNLFNHKCSKTEPETMKV